MSPLCIVKFDGRFKVVHSLMRSAASDPRRSFDREVSALRSRHSNRMSYVSPAQVLLMFQSCEPSTRLAQSWLLLYISSASSRLVDGASVLHQLRSAQKMPSPVSASQNLEEIEDGRPLA